MGFFNFIQQDNAYGLRRTLPPAALLLLADISRSPTKGEVCFSIYSDISSRIAAFIAKVPGQAAGQLRFPHLVGPRKINDPPAACLRLARCDGSPGKQPAPLHAVQ